MFLRFIMCGLVAAAVVTAVDGVGPAHALRAPTVAKPVKHVVVIYQENHSFDNLLGKLCAEIASGQITGHASCDGATTGRIANGTTIPLSRAADQVPSVSHTVGAQMAAIDGGNMDGFSTLGGCAGKAGYKCYSQFDPSGLPNLASLAEKFVISDRTFELATTPSWGGHMVLASATLDGFYGENPSSGTGGNGWGCDSGLTGKWWNGSSYKLVPTCIPDRNGHGPFEPSPVRYVPTIFDRLETARLTWKIYGGVGGPGSGYGWTICPTFYECLGSNQRANLLPAADVLPAARAGTLPAFSVVTPTSADSQHNNTSMAVGDNWIGSIVSAIMKGPDWASTAIFITYDDCGCFYDHVPPFAAGVGIRVPMVIVSPYAKPGYTDSNDATYASILAYTEHLFGLAPLTGADAQAYDYAGAFNYSQPPLEPVRMTATRISNRERAWLQHHRPPADDPT